MYPIRVQYFICIALVLFVSCISFYLQIYIGYKVVALLLLMTVSFIAMLFEIIPVIIAAILSAFIWNFFLIPPLVIFTDFYPVFIGSSPCSTEVHYTTNSSRHIFASSNDKNQKK